MFKSFLVIGAASPITSDIREVPEERWFLVFISRVECHRDTLVHSPQDINEI